LLKNITELPELIEWHEGMLLTPQHFQELTARAELLTHLMQSRGAVYGWGVLELKVDETALGGGVFRLLCVEAILPDGLLVLGGAEHGVELVFNLNKIEGERARIYLAVPRETAIFERTDYGRYQGILANEELTKDGVSEAAPTAIPRIQARMKLVSEEADLVGMTSIPLLEFARRGTVFTQTDYISPLLHVQEGSPLKDLFAPVRKLVRNKATELARNLQPGAKNSDLAGISQLQWLVSSLPTLEAVLASDQLHPYSLYLALTSLAGSVAFLSHARIPPVFTAYRHNELRASFEDLIRYIQLSISEGLIENWISKEFVLCEGGLRTSSGGSSMGLPCFEIAPSLEAVFGDKANLSAPYYGLMLRASAGMTDAMLVEWGQSCLLATEDRISDIELSRSLGAACERVSVLDELVPEPDSVLLRVKNDPRWLHPGKRLVLKPARLEKNIPETVTLFVRKRFAKG